jgi:hypothetical protein
VPFEQQHRQIAHDALTTLQDCRLQICVPFNEYGIMCSRLRYPIHHLDYFPAQN